MRHNFVEASAGAVTVRRCLCSTCKDFYKIQSAEAVLNSVEMPLHFDSVREVYIKKYMTTCYPDNIIK
jgi:hypothetical protein